MTTTTTNNTTKLAAYSLYSTLDEVQQTRTSVLVLYRTLEILTKKWGFEKAYRFLHSTIK